jgi:hypothetical protein
MDWTRGDRLDEFFGVLVDPWKLDKEYERVELGQVSLSSNYYTDERITGSMAPPPDFKPVGNRLLRIYMESTLDGEKKLTELGTFFMRRGQTTSKDDAKERDIELHSCIWRYMNDYVIASYSFAAGADCISSMQLILSRSGGKIETRGVKPTKLLQPVAWEPGTNELVINSWWADYMGCDGMLVDTHGRCYITPYVPLEKRQVVWTFEDGVNCMYVDEFIVDSNEDDLPNALQIWYKVGDYQYKVSRQLPESSPYSLKQRGRFVTAHYNYNNLPLPKGQWATCTNDSAKMYAQPDTASTVVEDLWTGGGGYVLDDQVEGWVRMNWQHGQLFVGWVETKNLFNKNAAEKRGDEYYSKLLSLAVSVEFTHHYAPIKEGDAVRFIRGNTNIIGIVHAMEIDELVPGVPTHTVIDVLNGALGDVYP